MNEQDEVEDTQMDTQENNHETVEITGGTTGGEPTPSTSTVNETNGEQQSSVPQVEYATIGPDGNPIPVELVVQGSDDQPIGVDINFLSSMIQFCRSAGLKDTEKMLAKEVGFTIAGEEPEEEEASAEEEEVYQDTPVDKKQKVFYGVIRDDISVLGDKKKKKDLKEAKKKDANAPPSDRIPLPYVPEFVLEERRQAYRENTRKGKISMDNPPSVCIFNACNTNGGLSSAEISENSSLYALGLNDGSVQIRTLADEYIKQVKHSSKLEGALEEEVDVDIYEQFPPDQKPTKVIFSGHSAAVTSTCFSPDRRALLTSSLDGTTRLWGIELRRGLVIYRHPCAVYQTRLSNRGLYFASSCADQSVHLWSTERIHPIRLFTGSFGATHALDFHPNCNYIIGGSNDTNVRMWDCLSASCVRLFSGHKGGIRGIKTSPDGRYIVSYSEDGMLNVWDIAQQKLAASQQLEPCSSKVPITFMRDGSVFAIGNPRWGLSFFSLESIISGDITETKVDPPGFLIHQYYTERTPILAIDFNRRNLVFCIGALNQ